MRCPWWLGTCWDSAPRSDPIQTAVLTGSHTPAPLCKYSQHTSSLRGPLDTEALWRLGSSSAIRLTSLNTGLCLHFTPTVRCLPSTDAVLSCSSCHLPISFFSLNQSGRTCLSTAADPLWCARLGHQGRICTIKVHRSRSRFSCGTSFRNKELCLYFIVLVVFVFSCRLFAVTLCWLL